MSETLRRIQFVTTYYDWLQGLRFVPLGLMGLGLAVWLAVSGEEKPRLREHPVEVALAVGLAVGLYAVLGAYYRRRFGVVRASASTRKRMVWGIGLAAALGLLTGGGAAVAQKLSGSTHLPVLVGLLLLGLTIVVGWYWSGRVAHHYLPVAGVVVVLGLLDALGASPVCALLERLPFATASRCAVVTLTGVTGATLIMVGLLDHRLLVRMLGGAPEPEEASE